MTGYLSPDPFGPPAWAQSSPKRSFDKTGSINRKSKRKDILLIETNYYSTIEVTINDRKEINATYREDKYSYTYISGKWTDKNNLLFTYSRRIEGGGGRDVYDTITAIRIP